MRSTPLRVARITAIATVALLALAGCSAAGSGGDAPAAPVAATAGWPIDATTLDPAAQQTDQDRELFMNVYQPLLDYELAEHDGIKVSQGLASTPTLAESWKLDGSTATFTIRDGVEFYPTGNPVTAEDAVFSIGRALNGNGMTELNNSGIYDASQLVALDEKTLQITYTDAAGLPITATDLNLAALRIPYFGIIDSQEALTHATDDDPFASEWLAENVAGTGPYYVSARQPGQSIQLTAVPDVWSGEPDVQTVNIQVLNDANVSSLLRGGSLNVGLFGVGPNDATTLEDNGFSVFHADTFEFLYLQLAEDRGPLADVRVRQAVANVMPYDALNEQVFEGRAKRALSFTSESSQGYTPAWEGYGDVDAAKALMTEAGVDSISTTLTYSSELPSYESSAILIKDALAQIGIDVTLVPQTSAGMFGVILGRAAGDSVGENDGMVLHNLSVFIDDAKGPTSFWAMPGALNFQRFEDPKIAELQNTYALNPLDDARAAAYAEVQEIAAADASFIPLLITGRTIVTSPDLSAPAFQPEIGVRYFELEN
jgi:peptide/nickel transport system substrate-binding protein